MKAKTNKQVWYHVEHIDYAPTPSGRRSTKLDDRTYRERWFETKQAAVRYAKGVNANHKKWLAAIAVNKAVFSHEKW